LIAIRDETWRASLRVLWRRRPGQPPGRHLQPATAQGDASRFVYSSLAQEKTGDFWVNGRLFGHQTCHATEDVEHADYVLFIGTNPYQAHGIPNARDTLRDLQRDPARTMVVVDPRRSETAKQADIHLQIKPGTDAFLMLAMLSLIVREGLHDREFLSQHCQGFAELERELLAVPIADYVHRSELALGRR
jgi:hypothetical protein